MMAEPAPAIIKEPLISGHPRALQVLYEMHPHFGRSAQAVACPQLRPRKGQRLGGLTALAFTSFFEGLLHLRASEDGGRILQTTDHLSLSLRQSARGT
jgi:hypothetical protein